MLAAARDIALAMFFVFGIHCAALETYCLVRRRARRRAAIDKRRR